MKSRAYLPVTLELMTRDRVAAVEGTGRARVEAIGPGTYESTEHLRRVAQMAFEWRLRWGLEHGHIRPEWDCGTAGRGTG
jgi:hypothetical protein